MADNSTPNPVPSQTAPRVSRWRRWRNRLLYLLYLAVVLEIGLQLFYFATVGQWLPGRTHLAMFEPNEYSGYFNQPHVNVVHNSNEFKSMIYTNGQGLRTSVEAADYPLGKQPGKKRVLLLGPSFAFGWGVNYEQTFAARLQAMLADSQQFDPAVEVINAGVPSLGPVAGLNWYRHVGEKFAPDLVIQFCYGSMQVESTGRWNNIEADEHGRLVAKNLSPKLRFIGYAKKSALVYYGWLTATHVRSWFHQADSDSEVAGAGRELELYSAFDRGNAEVIDSMKFYEDLRSTVERSGAKLLIVFFPLSYCIHEQDIGRWSHLGVINVDRQNTYNAAFCRHLQSLDFDCLNITDDLKQAAEEGQRLYYFVDIHWTPEGNEVAARAVARHLAPDEEARRGED
jgi:hypothetical protein